MEIAVAAFPARHRIARLRVHLHVEPEQVVAPLEAVIGGLVEEELGLLALAHQASLHVRERGDDRVDRAVLDVLPQLFQRQHRPATLLRMQPETIAARLWPDASARIEPLGGGITNHNFKVAVDGEAYVLRIGGKDTGLLGIERHAEHEAALRAAAVGTGPEVFAFLEDEGVLVTRFVEGEPVPIERMRTPQGLARAVNALKPFHAGAPVPARFDSFAVVSAYAATAAERGVRIPDAYVRANELADRIGR